jgi:hypothetical protein
MGIGPCFPFSQEGNCEKAPCAPSDGICLILSLKKVVESTTNCYTFIHCNRIECVGKGRLAIVQKNLQKKLMSGRRHRLIVKFSKMRIAAFFVQKIHHNSPAPLWLIASRHTDQSKSSSLLRLEQSPGARRYQLICLN